MLQTLNRLQHYKKNRNNTQFIICDMQFLIKLILIKINATNYY